VPALPIEHPLNVAVPLTAAFGFAEQLRVAPAGVVMVRLMGFVPEVVSPFPSWMATTGWVANAAPLVDEDGVLTNVSLLAVEKMKKLELTPLRLPALAVKV
jgi:hypothetical protein